MTDLAKRTASAAFQTCVTLSIATAGGVLFFWLGLPAPWLSGAVLAVTLALTTGLKLRVPDRMRDVVLFGLGLSMGGSVTPETLDAIGRWPMSIVMLLLTMLAIMVAITILLRRAGWDRDTAILASAPGALSSVLALALAKDLDARRIVVVQCVRLIALVALVPSLAWTAAPLANASMAAHTASWLPVALEWPALLAASGLGAYVMHRLGVPAPLMIGALIGSAVLHGPGVATAQVPPPVLAVGFIVLGAFIALRFEGVTRAELKQDAVLALVALLVAVSIGVLGAAITVWLTGLPLGPVMVAFAPGGVEAMIAIAFALDLDPAYVGAHHVLRFVAIALLLPIFMSRVTAQKNPSHG
jgi:membrane AbrB-like protein